MIVVYAYNAASHSLGVALHSGSGGLCRGRKPQGPHEVGSQVPRVPAMACRVSFNVGGCILSVDMAIQSGIQSFFLAMAGTGSSFFFFMTVHFFAGTVFGVDTAVFVHAR